MLVRQVRRLKWLAGVSWCLLVASLASADITIVLQNEFIEQHKRRATIDTSFTVDKAHRRANPAVKDGDLHAAGRADEVMLPIVAEIMNANDDRTAVAAIHGAESSRQTIALSGAWRLWCEHGGDDAQIQGAPLQRFTTTNPDHVFEIHPVTQLGGRSLLSTLKPIQGYRTKDAHDAFTKYEDLRCRIELGDGTTTIVTTMAGFNYTEFIMEINSEPLEVPDGVFYICKIRDLQSHLLVRNRRVVLVKDSEVERRARGKPIGTRIHVLGLPRINLSLVSWRVRAAAEGRREVLTWGLPYEMIVVGFYEFVPDDDGGPEPAAMNVVTPHPASSRLRALTPADMARFRSAMPPVAGVDWNRPNVPAPPAPAAPQGGRPASRDLIEERLENREGDRGDSNLTLMIEGEAGAQVTVVPRDRGDEPPPPVFEGKIGRDGRVMATIPKGYYVILCQRCQTAIVPFDRSVKTLTVKLKPRS